MGESQKKSREILSRNRKQAQEEQGNKETGWLIWIQVLFDATVLSLHHAFSTTGLDVLKWLGGKKKRFQSSILEPIIPAFTKRLSSQAASPVYLTETLFNTVHFQTGLCICHVSSTEQSTRVCNAEAHLSYRSAESTVFSIHKGRVSLFSQHIH